MVDYAMRLSALIDCIEPYLAEYNTRMLGGFEEPFYAAEKDGQPARIQFSHDYIRSALHELAHWCVAGKARRMQDDYGYWYAPDGRTQAQQKAFFKMEVKPQAIEWAFAECCGIAFDVSVDNLGHEVEGIADFRARVEDQLLHYRSHGFPKRAADIMNLLEKAAAPGSSPGRPQHTESLSL